MAGIPSTYMKPCTQIFSWDVSLNPRTVVKNKPPTTLKAVSAIGIAGHFGPLEVDGYLGGMHVPKYLG